MAGAVQELPFVRRCMNGTDFEKQLHKEGFVRTYIWEDGAGVFYPDHTHPNETAHVIVGGEMAVTSEGRTQTYGVGDRFDVPARTIHSARMGPKGWRYLIGEM